MTQIPTKIAHQHHEQGGDSICGASAISSLIAKITENFHGIEAIIGKRENLTARKRDLPLVIVHAFGVHITENGLILDVAIWIGLWWINNRRGLNNGLRRFVPATATNHEFSGATGEIGRYTVQRYQVDEFAFGIAAFNQDRTHCVTYCRLLSAIAFIKFEIALGPTRIESASVALRIDSASSACNCESATLVLISELASEPFN